MLYFTTGYLDLLVAHGNPYMLEMETSLYGQRRKCYGLLC